MKDNKVDITLYRWAGRKLIKKIRELLAPAHTGCAISPCYRPDRDPVGEEADAEFWA